MGHDPPMQRTHDHFRLQIRKPTLPREWRLGSLWHISAVRARKVKCPKT